VIADPFLGSGRTLWLDTLRHSYVDLRNPRHLEFEYTRAIRDAIDAVHPGRQALTVLHVGGGGFTLPRYVRATRPGSRNLVLEIDDALVREARRRLGLVTGPGLRVRVGDARLGIREERDDSYDVVVGDAFSGLSVPWHLTTREFVREVRRVLRPDGLYALNVIDYPPLDFMRAEVATLRDVFPHVAVVAPPGALEGQFGDNFVLLASDRPLPLGTLRRLFRKTGDAEAIRSGPGLEGLVRGARVLTDDFAPVDQLISWD
jgi:spermidine synthase